MPYDKQTWTNGPEGRTPISASRLNHLEDGVASRADAVHTHLPVDVTGFDAAVDARVRDKVSVFGVNVRDFGAVGNAVTDDTAAIQAAIDSLPEVGGTVYIPRGTYLISAAIELRNALRIVGENNSSSVIYQVTPNEHGLAGTDILTLAIHNLRVVGPGAASGTGTGIMLERLNNNATNYLSIRDVYVRTFGRDGVYVSNSIVSHFDTVICEQNGQNGFNLVGLNGIIGTSTTLSNCFANANGGSGYRIDTMGYMAFNACAADHNTISYDILNGIGLTFNGCGSEGSETAAWKFTGGYGSTVTGGWVFAQDGVGVHITGGAIGISLIGISETTPRANATAFVKVDAGCKTTIMNLHNDKPNVLAPGTTQIINDVAGNTAINGSLDVQGSITLNGVSLSTQRGSRWYLSNSEHSDYGDVIGMISGDIFMYPSRDLFQYNGSSWVYSGSLTP
ncbi:glycosyl hydrolase family 28-related protein [Prescottella equi]|uniref:glycosyl hydrolase family 28-related protein n=1 Tax=Rhodococcus hoagii TaxID=43767 RepID=UPI000A11CF6A|nr:glycosyl hydrolase family 28-related protein [Prescottella equi]ORL15422.1 hypothetical protein A6I85_05975 [Prescottella equi]